MILRKLIKEWVLGLLLAAVLLAFSGTSFVSRFDGWMFDAAQHLSRPPVDPLRHVAIVQLDAESLSALGGMPWERGALVSLLDKLRNTRSNVVLALPLSELQHNPAVAGLDAVRNFIDSSSKIPAAQSQYLIDMIDKEQKSLDIDSQLATAIGRMPHLFLAIAPANAWPETVTGMELAGSTASGSLPGILARGLTPLLPLESASLDDIGTPNPQFADKASQLGSLSLLRDSDGRVRGLQLLHKAGNGVVPTIPLLLAAGKPEKLAASPGKLSYGDIDIKTGRELQAFLRLYPNAQFETYPLSRVLADDFKTSQLKGKAIIIAGDTLMRRQFDVPGGGKLTSAEIMALATANILNHDLYGRTDLLGATEWALFIVTVLLLTLLFPRLRYGYCIAVAAAGVLSMAGFTGYLLLTDQLWMQSGLAILLMAGGLALIGLRRLYTSQSVRHLADVAYTQRLLGIAYQEQGKKEQAFETFKKLPPEPGNLELIYNLALDFERQRRYERAAAAYQHILQIDPTFKDTAKRKINAEKLGIAALTSSGQFSASVLLMPGEDGQKPRLGRYEVEKEIGKGAMGSVYLGRDPKIDRTVAIKTLALSQEFEASELKDVEERFFHEAAAAGRLNHPNIVTIYDAGEEHDLAYIAMEYLDGQPLSDFTRSNKLLPVPTVLDIIAQVASGLDYAYKQGIVHRDIKPGNIMYNQKSGVVKITDFGIARVTSSSRTKTGTMLGTPAYMSPEQVTCQPVDGRADIFSLGATMFVLLTGKRPFSADSVAALTFQITSEKHQDPLKLRPELPPCVKTIIDRSLQKDPGNRYQDGLAMQRALQRCLKNFSEEE
ncbi:MAG TPA: protein kinase [Mariprofundaceae bacterium]|nr:protein kinase [Mariprofundaceae bacterium]